MRTVAKARAWTAQRLACLALLCLVSLPVSAQLLSKTLTQTTTTLKQTTSSLLQTTSNTTTLLLPLTVTASGNHAEIQVGNVLLPVADVSLDFDDASNLNANNLGVTAQLVDTLDQALLSRLPDLGLTSLTSALPLLITIEPPTSSGLTFRNTGRMEIHTHLLPYSIGSSLRVFKAPLGGPFRDVTDEIAQGSVRARTTYGGFSQFLILVDLRNTGTVVNEKIGWLRNRVAMLPESERPALTAFLDQTESAVGSGDYTTALAAIDAFRDRAQARAGTYIANEWRATHDTENHAGQLIAGARTLRFSVAYLRDFGQ